MKVEWNQAGTLELTGIDLNSTNVWNGSITSGVWADTTDFNIPTNTTYSTGNTLNFTDRNPIIVGTQFKITLEFTDNSTFITDWYTYT